MSMMMMIRSPAEKTTSTFSRLSLILLSFLSHCVCQDNSGNIANNLLWLVILVSVVFGFILLTCLATAIVLIIFYLKGQPPELPVKQSARSARVGPTSSIENATMVAAAATSTTTTTTTSLTHPNPALFSRNVRTSTSDLVMPHLPTSLINFHDQHFVGAQSRPNDELTTSQPIARRFSDGCVQPYNTPAELTSSGTSSSSSSSSSSGGNDGGSDTQIMYAHQPPLPLPLDPHSKLSMSTDPSHTTSSSNHHHNRVNGDGNTVYEPPTDYSSTSPREKQYVVYLKDQHHGSNRVEPGNKRPWVNYFNVSEPPGSKALRKVYRSSKYQVFSIQSDS